MAREPLLSVVITGYTTRRLGDIHELLDEIAAQGYPRIETILVTESAELYERLAARCAGDGTRLLFSRESGLSANRNLAISRANGDITAFIDDDALPFPDWASEMVRTYDDGSVIGATGPACPLWPGEPAAWFPEELYWIIGATAWSDSDKLREVRNAWGMNMSFRREAFEVARFAADFGLHDSRRADWLDPPSEDVDLSLRVREGTGRRIVYNPKARVRHRVNQKVSHGFISRRAYSVGYQRRQLKRLYPGQAGLDDERRLLRRILTRLLPGILAGFFTRPAVSWRRLSVTATALFFVAIGYLHLLRPFVRTG